MEQEIRLKSPDLRKVQEFMNVIDDAASDEADAIFCEDDRQELREMLNWILTKRANQQDYHKKRQIHQKAERALLEAALRGAGKDVDAIKRRAHNLAADELVDTSNEEPVLPEQGGRS